MNEVEKPLVSVIVGTYNSSAMLDACLSSILNQTYKPIELIVADNYSTDDSMEVARKYTDIVFQGGPERSAKRNTAVRKATGQYVLILDADMELTAGVVAACVATFQARSDIQGVIIPEESFGQGFWAECKRLERSFYVGVDWVEAARFFKRQTFLDVGGFDETMVSGEDWDLSQRIAALGRLDRVPDMINHNEGHLRLFRTLNKKSYYAHKFKSYTAQSTPQNKRNPYAIVLKRFGLFLSRPYKLFKNPMLGMGMLFMKVCEFGFGAFGYLGGGRASK